MENCLKRRELESDSELEDTEDSELDNDLDINLLPGDRKEIPTTSDRNQRQQFHDYDSGLISPYKRLRVEDLAYTSAESQAGEEEAHSLLRSIDGCDDLSWMKSREERGQIPNSVTSSPTKISDGTAANEAGSNLKMTPRRQLVKRGTSIDEGLRQLAMDTQVREFPRPPAIDRGQRSPKAKRELDSLLLASYHPDFQTLESRRISYHSRSQGDLLTAPASKVEVSRTNSGANTCGSFDLLELHAGEDAGDAIYEMMSDYGATTQPSDPSFSPEASGAHPSASHVEVSENQSRSVGISTRGLPMKASPLPAPGSLVSTVTSSSQKETNSDSVSAVYDTVDSEPEGTSWPSSRLDTGSGSSLPKLTTSSGAQTSEFRESDNVPSMGAHRHARLTGMDEPPVNVMALAPDPISFGQSHLKSLSWDDICKQYQQHLQHQQAPGDQPLPGPHPYQHMSHLHHAPFPPAPASSGAEDFTALPVGQREMLSYLGYPARFRRGSQRSLQSHSSQESGRQHRSTNSKSSQESIDRVEKSYPSSLVISENKSKKAVLQSPGNPIIFVPIYILSVQSQTTISSITHTVVKIFVAFLSLSTSCPYKTRP
ncbi:hypothetical protein Btru_073609 [Bulinus truncatus]|nr:hypothetical protein Btru_073609 [Bulinus truncatus]